MDFAEHFGLCFIFQLNHLALDSVTTNNIKTNVRAMLLCLTLSWSKHDWTPRASFDYPLFLSSLSRNQSHGVKQDWKNSLGKAAQAKAND